MRFLVRFPEQDIEEEFLRTERDSRRKTTRILVVLGVVTVGAIAASNFRFMPRSVALSYSAGAAVMAAFMLLLFAATFSRAYLSKRAIDLVLFAGIAAGAALMIRSLLGHQEVIGFTDAGMALVILTTFVMFAGIGFVANARQFLLLTAAFYAGTATWIFTSDWSLAGKIYTLSSFGTFLLFAAFVNLDLDRRARQNFDANRELAAERRKSEELLYNVLPQNVAARLKAGETVADAIARITVIFVDMVGFSQLSRKLPPDELVRILNRFFTAADQCAAAHRVEKVKTIGDAYLAVAGGPDSSSGEVEAIAFARELIDRTRNLVKEIGVDLRIRVGIHSGPVVGGVIGSSRLAYDYWGDTMNVASRIEGIAEVNGIAVSAATFNNARQAVPFSPPELVTLKGIGETEIYRVRD
jgi:adenylate cyclase